jgi:hypothetical protein
VLATVPGVAREFIGSIGIFEIGEPPGIALKFTGIHPVPSVKEAAAAVADCLKEAKVLPSRVVSVIVVGTDVAGSEYDILDVAGVTPQTSAGVALHKLLFAVPPMYAGETLVM